ncbi:TauD/TfdA family dioxygenase [Streptomyces sp. 7R007]
MRWTKASVVPARVSCPHEVSDLVRRDGAAILTGVCDERAALDAGRRSMGAKAVRIGTQIEATERNEATQARVVAAQSADSRGRRRYLTTAAERMPPHNDGYAFGDDAPDHLFLWCERPAAVGGESFLIDTARLLDLFAAAPDSADMVQFCWNTPIDHSEPNYPQERLHPLVRLTPRGRFQGRYHPYLSAAHGPMRQRDRTFIRRWEQAVLSARDHGPMFRLEAGDMLCIDNYRMLHGRDAHNDPRRRLCSIWGWSTDAVSLPEGPLNIVDPWMATAAPPQDT